MKILKSTKIKLNTKVPVYDLTIKESNPCFALKAGIMSHNTKRWRSPIHTLPWNSELRELLIPRTTSSILVHGDLSQSEIRVIAYMAGETELLKQFRENPKMDVHRTIAGFVWRKNPKDITDGERRYSKMAVFSILFGKSEHNFAIDFLRGDIVLAKLIFTNFYTAFPGIKKWCEDQNKRVKELGYVETLFGDKIKVESQTSNRAARISQNAPVQSSSSSLAALGIWDTWELCQLNQIEAVPNCFTHDSGDWEVNLSHLIRFFNCLNQASVVNLTNKYGVPIKMDFEIGICQNFMLEIKDLNIIGNSCTFEFECAEIFFDKIINKLKEYWKVDLNITKEEIRKESMNELFMTKRAYSMYIGKPIKYLKGNLSLSTNEKGDEI